MLIFLFVLFSVLFHVLMMYEGRYYSWITGFYWTLTTMSTLGFGDITFHSDLGRLFSIVVLFSGIVFLLVMLPFTFIQFFYAPWLEEQNKSRAPRSIPENTAGHVILTHFDAVAVTLIEKLGQYGITYVVLTPELQQALDLHDRGYRVITVTNADLDDSLDILHRAGANLVMSFSSLLTTTIMNLIQPQKVLMLSEGLNVFRMELSPRLGNMVLRDVKIREKTGCSVVAVKKGDRLTINPDPAIVLEKGDELVLIGNAQVEKLFTEKYPAATEPD